MTTKHSFSDDALLLGAGVLIAGLSWVFWHYLGQESFVVLLAIVFAALLIDNRRLRKEVERLKQSRP
jgi:uncharacterized membrane protein SirB2